MKKIISTLALVLLIGTGVKAQEIATAPPDPNASEIKFETEVIDYGMLEYDANTMREFKFKNTGKSPLILSNIQTQCGCTNVDGWPKEPIAPGKSATFKVKYDSKRVGKFDKKITVTSNAKNPTVILTIKGEVKPAPATNTGAAPAGNTGNH
jgi:hypothetical protein